MLLLLLLRIVGRRCADVQRLCATTATAAGTAAAPIRATRSTAGCGHGPNAMQGLREHDRGVQRLHLPHYCQHAGK
jgi:hypothetical protein